MGVRGQKLIEEKVCRVLEQAWHAAFSTKSDFSRLNADYIAIAASQNLLTTQGLDGQYTRQWFLTPAGLRLLWQVRKEAS